PLRICPRPRVRQRRTRARAKTRKHGAIMSPSPEPTDGSGEGAGGEAVRPAPASAVFGSERRRRWWQRLRRPAFLGTLRRLTPLSDAWGFDRGTPIDRYYIERFLKRHQADIRGRVLEIRDSTYTQRFGAGV